MKDIKLEYINTITGWICNNKDKVKSINFTPISDDVEFIEIKTKYNIEITLFFNDEENQILTIFDNNGEWVSSSICTINELVSDLSDFFIKENLSDFIYS